MPHIIKNFESLSTSPKRQVALQLVENALEAIQPSHVMNTHFTLSDQTLKVQEKSYDLSQYEKIFLVGFGKGSSGICKFIEQTLGERLTRGFDIDVVDETFSKVEYTKGTHPLPSQENIDYTKKILEQVKDLSGKDLVLVVICGGGSVLFEAPHTLSLEELTEMNKSLLKSGATISEMNVIRKHVSAIKGGGFAKHLHPAKLVCMLFSDVPGNDLSVIASGPTVKDPSTLDQTHELLTKYSVTLPDNALLETPKEQEYFENVDNILMVSNVTALNAMRDKAKELGYKAVILTDRLQGDANTIGKVLLSETKPGEILLAGGETTVKVTGNGTGGRNQTVVLATVQSLENQVIVSFGSDGWDFTTFAGAIGDKSTVEKAKEKGLDINQFLSDNNSTPFFQTVGDGIDTGKLESNVSDLLMVLNV